MKLVLLVSKKGNFEQYHFTDECLDLYGRPLPGITKDDYYPTADEIDPSFVEFYSQEPVATAPELYQATVETLTLLDLNKTLVLLPAVTPPANSISNDAATIATNETSRASDTATVAITEQGDINETAAIDAIIAKKGYYCLAFAQASSNTNQNPLVALFTANQALAQEIVIPTAPAQQSKSSNSNKTSTAKKGKDTPSNVALQVSVIPLTKK